MRVHHSVTVDRVYQMANDSLFGCGYPGICFYCGEETDGVEPDAQEYECDCCGENQVYGAEIALMLVG